MRIAGLHIRETRNAGDRWSSPLDYFSFPGHAIELGDMRAPPAGPFDLAIFGGGSIVTSPDFAALPCPAIAWGVGHHERRPPWDAAMRSAHDAAARSCVLYFARDAIPGIDRVPCASCMHPAFDDPRPARHAVVRYSAARRVPVVEPGDAPHMTNEDGTIEEAISFLASGRVVVTSSYHGAYWARLLRREVRLVPWGSKFAHLPDLDLAECRARNAAAHKRVLEWIATSQASTPSPTVTSC